MFINGDGKPAGWVEKALARFTPFEKRPKPNENLGEGQSVEMKVVKLDGKGGEAGRASEVATSRAFGAPKGKEAEGLADWEIVDKNTWGKCTNGPLRVKEFFRDILGLDE